MGIDLSGLDLDMGPQDAGSSSPTGEPLRLKLSDVLEDPNQPRKEFPQDSMEEMVASVKERGVKTPISVKPHPTLPGKYLLNYGARRYRASVALGLDFIPAIIDADHNDYDQVIENLQRENLTALEMATFIQRKIKDGEKPVAIAARLGKKRSFVTEHQALIDPPSAILEVYSSGRCTSARTLYDLRSLYEKFPEQVESYLAANPGDVDRRKVAELSELLKGPKPKAPPADTSPVVRHDEQTASAGDGASVRHDEQTGPANSNSDAGRVNQDEQNSVGSAGGATETTSEKPAEKILPHNPANEKALGKPAAKEDPSRLKKPVMLVEYGGRAAMVLIFNRPSTPGLLWIKYEDNGEEAEVDAGRCKINVLQDASA